MRGERFAPNGAALLQLLSLDPGSASASLRYAPLSGKGPAGVAQVAGPPAAVSRTSGESESERNADPGSSKAKCCAEGAPHQRSVHTGEGSPRPTPPARTHPPPAAAPRKPLRRGRGRRRP